MERILVVPTYVNDFSNGVERRHIDNRSTSDNNNNNNNNENSHNNATNKNNDLDVVVSSQSSYNNYSNNYTNNNQSSRKQQNMNSHSSSSSGTRFTPMEFEEELQPLRIRQSNSLNSVGRGRKGNKRRSNDNNNGFYFDNTIGTGSKSSSNNNNNRQQYQYQQQRSKLLPVDRLLIIIRLHLEYYPRICCGFIIIVISIVSYCIWKSDYIQKPITRNRLSEDYTNMDLHYNWKKSKIHHWCLWVRFFLPFSFLVFVFHIFSPKFSKNIKAYNLTVLDI
jgi:hypothetical protein